MKVRDFKLSGIKKSIIGKRDKAKEKGKEKFFVTVEEYLLYNGVVEEGCKECEINYMSEPWREFREAVYECLIKEYMGTGVKLITDIVMIDMELTMLLNKVRNGTAWFEVMVDENVKDIYGVFIIEKNRGFMTDYYVSFTLSGLTDKSKDRDIFILIDRIKGLLKEFMDSGEKYFYLMEVIKEGKPLAHNQRFLKWFDKFDNTRVVPLYNVWYGRVCNGKNG